MKKILYLTIVAATLSTTGCSNEGTPEPSAQQVRFSATLPAATRTTPDGNAWVAGDRLGVWMLREDGMNTYNKEFTVTDAASGALEPVDGMPFYYPRTGTADFAAVYPWTVSMNDYYTVNVTYQTDALYANAVDVANSAEPVNLEFRHLMSKITLNVRAGDGVTADQIAAMAASDVVFDGMPFEATFNISDGSIDATLTAAFSPEKAAAAESGADATFTTILVPQPDGAEGRSVTFTLGGETFEWQIPAGHDFDAGSHYVDPVTINRAEVTVAAHSIADWTTVNHGSDEADLIPSVVVGDIIWAGVNVSTPGNFAATPFAYDGANQYFFDEATIPTNGTGTDGSICPAGWRMPTIDDYGALMNVATCEIMTSNHTVGMNVITPGGTLFFALSGHSEGAAEEGVACYYWATTPQSATPSYFL
ncbi:MAG: fimbrillin family protein [Alistipes sp.]|jgi:hypothetical protein|nr:fimbrillin family protein [Alistipes sp.]